MSEQRALAGRLALLKPCECRLRFHQNCGCIGAESCPWCGDEGRRMPTLEEVLDALEERGVRGVGFAGYRDRLGDPYLAQDRSLVDIFGKREFSGGSRLEAALLRLEARRG